jgi:hypothetical protein
MKLFAYAALLAVSTPALAGIAFLKSEYESGLNKICIYDHRGSDVAITIKALRFCPATLYI